MGETLKRLTQPADVCITASQEEDPSLNSLAWAHAEQDASGDPLVCVSGGNYLIKVLNVITGTAVRVRVVRSER